MISPYTIKNPPALSLAARAEGIMDKDTAINISLRTGGLHRTAPFQHIVSVGGG